MILIVPVFYGRSDGAMVALCTASLQFRIMKDLVLATGNPGKVNELRELLPDGFVLRDLLSVGLDPDLPETGDTLEENALQKARHVYQHTGIASLSDDTGLEVDALDGAPGVMSARFAGESKDPKANMDELLRRMDGVSDRSARFRTVIAWVDASGHRTFEGVVEGHISKTPAGEKGFGYDPVFIPEGEKRTFAQMSRAEKGAISHRSRAMRKLIHFLTEERDP